MATRVSLLLADVAVGVAGVLRDTLDEPHDFAIVAWPTSAPDQAAFASSLAHREELVATIAGLVARWKKAAEAAGEKPN
jgi:hypothetical protein